MKNQMILMKQYITVNLKSHFKCLLQKLLKPKMRRELLTWLSFLVILCLLALSACQSTPTAPKARGYGARKQLKDVYEFMKKLNRKAYQTTVGEMHVVHHLKVSKKAKGSYGAASNLKPPRSSASAASSSRINLSTLFFPAVVTVGWFIFSLF